MLRKQIPTIEAYPLPEPYETTIKDIHQNFLFHFQPIMQKKVSVDNIESRTVDSDQQGQFER